MASIALVGTLVWLRFDRRAAVDADSSSRSNTIRPSRVDAVEAGGASDATRRVDESAEPKAAASAAPTSEPDSRITIALVGFDPPYVGFHAVAVHEPCDSLFSDLALLEALACSHGDAGGRDEIVLDGCDRLESCVTALGGNMTKSWRHVRPGTRLEWRKPDLDGPFAIVRVVDVGGRPVSGASVRWRTSSTAPARDISSGRVTDGEGECRIPVSATSGGCQVLSRKGRLRGHAVLRDPSTSVEVVLRDTVYRVIGRVLDPEARPIEGARVLTDLGAQARSRVDGRFEVECDLLFGSATLTVEAPGHAPSELHVVAPASIDDVSERTIRLVDTVLVAGGSLRVSVEDRQGLRLSNCDVVVQGIVIGSDAREAPAYADRHETTTDAAGEAVVGVVGGRSYDVLVSRVGFASVPQSGMTVPVGRESSLRVTMSAEARLKLSVQTASGGGSVPDLEVRVSPLDGMAANRRILSILSADRSLAEVRAGDWIRALSPGENSLVVRSPGFVTVRRTVSLHAGDNPLEIGMERGRCVRGGVIDAAGNAIAGADVELFADDEGESWIVTADAGGRFEFHCVARSDGRLRLRATAPSGDDVLVGMLQSASIDVDQEVVVR